MNKKRKATNPVAYISVPIDLIDFAQSVASSTGCNDLIDLVVAIDEQVADVGFTEDLIVALASSLKGDLIDTEDRAALVSRIAKTFETGAPL